MSRSLVLLSIILIAALAYSCDCFVNFELHVLDADTKQAMDSVCVYSVEDNYEFYRNFTDSNGVCKYTLTTGIRTCSKLEIRLEKPGYNSIKKIYKDLLRQQPNDTVYLHKL